MNTFYCVEISVDALAGYDFDISHIIGLCSPIFKKYGKKELEYEVASEERRGSVASIRTKEPMLANDLAAWMVRNGYLAQIIKETELLELQKHVKRSNPWIN